MRVPLCHLLALLASLGLSGTATANSGLLPGQSPAACGEAGIVNEFSNHAASFDVYLTDASGARFPNPLAANVPGVALPGGGFGAQINVPPTPGACDARNVTRQPIAMGGGGGPGGTAVADLSLESLILLADGTSQIEGLFGRVRMLAGSGHIVIPDLYADTNGDGHLGNGDVLYSLVDIRAFFAPPPSFALGDVFTITGGVSSALPGMMFSTTPFVFDHNNPNGFSGTPFDGSAQALTDHDLSVPEPASIGLFAASLTMLLLLRMRKA